MILLSPGGDSVQRYASEPDRLMVATVEGITTFARSDDNYWIPVQQGLPGCFVSALTRLESGAFIAATRGVGMAKSEDGQTWKWINHGITCHDFWAAKAVRLDGRELVVGGTMPAHLFVSEDAGERWSERPALREVPSAPDWFFPPQPRLGHVKDIVGFEGDKLFVGIEIGSLMVSEDAGQRFRELPVSPGDISGVDMHRVLVHPDRPERIVCCTGGGMITSEDRGATWRRGPAPPALDYPDAAVIHPDDPDLIFVAGGVGWPQHWARLRRAQGKVARSRDGGLTWERLLGGLPDGQRAIIAAMSLATWPGGTAVFVADTDGQIFSSADLGDHWRMIGETAPVSKGDFYRILAKGRGPLAHLDDLHFTETQLATMASAHV